MLRVTCYGPGLRLAAAVLINSSIRFQFLHDGAPPRSESSDFVGDETHDGMWFCRSNALDALTPCVGHNRCADSLFASFASGRNWLLRVIASCVWDAILGKYWALRIWHAKINKSKSCTESGGYSCQCRTGGLDRQKELDRIGFISGSENDG